MSAADRPPLHALTIWRPWDAAIAAGWKPIENREWAPPAWLVGKFFAIHGGKQYDREGAEWMRENADVLAIAGEVALDQPARAQMIVAVARLVGAVEIDDSKSALTVVRNVVGGLPPPQVELVRTNPWAMGPWCWLLDDVVALPSGVPCRGMQKLWTVPDEVAAQVREQYRVAKERAA